MPLKWWIIPCDFHVWVNWPVCFFCLVKFAKSGYPCYNKGMNKIFELWNKTSLVAKIAVGLVIGAVLGIAVPQATFLSVLGTLFVGALKAIAPVLVFFLVMSSLANASSIDKKKFGTVIFFYMFTTFLAATVAVFAAKIFPVTITLSETAQGVTPPKGIAEVLNNLLRGIVTNPFFALAHANYLAILFWAILMGLALKNLADVETEKKVIKTISDTVTKVVRMIIGFAPFGILGIVFETVSTNGISIFTGYGKLIVLLVGAMLFTALVINPIVVFFALRHNPYPLVLKCLKESGITAFFTRSSAANIPVNMDLCERLGLNRELYSVSLPLGATINMDGAASVITIMSLTAAHTLGIQVDIPTAILLSFISTLGACGASGVAGGSLLLIPMACSLLGIPDNISMQVVAVGFIIGVIQDSLETALNSSSDVIFAATAEFMEWKKEGKKLPV